MSKNDTGKQVPLNKGSRPGNEGYSPANKGYQPPRYEAKPQGTPPKKP